MKVKNSRGIVTKLICCMALVVIASAVAFSQTPKSGALLTIDGTAGTTAVHVKIYDSQIHSGAVRTPAGNGSCSALAGSDDIPTDAYVLQGGSATGCDPGDDFEVTDNNNNTTNTVHQAFGKADLSGFHIETHYICGPGPCGTVTGTGGAVCNTSNTICANPDNGFITITNNTGLAFTGTISLTGNSPGQGDPWCPVGGAASDTSTSGLTTTGAGQSVTLALGSQGNPTPKNADSSNCGGFNAAQTLPLTANQPSTASFGKDDYVIKPLNSAAGDTLDVLPVPVPAGPTGSEQSPAASSLTFSAGSHFLPTTYGCIPYADFSAPNNPVCVELHLMPGGPSNGNYLYTATNDFNIDKNSLAGGIGGPSFLGHHGVYCPDSGFDIDIFFTYTAPSATFGDPLKGGGSGTGSCWVAAFDPNAAAIPTGTTFSSFTGFQSPVSDTDLNLVKSGSGVPLIWTYFSSPGVPITDLGLCASINAPTSSACPVPVVPATSSHWVFVGTIVTPCMIDNTPNTATDTTVAAGSSSLQNFGNGTYQYNLKTQKGATGCFDAVLIFDTGLTLFPANFKYTK